MPFLSFPVAPRPGILIGLHRHGCPAEWPDGVSRLVAPPPRIEAERERLYRGPKLVVVAFRAARPGAHVRFGHVRYLVPDTALPDTVRA